MKTLIIIWSLAIATVFGSIQYISAEIDKMVIEGSQPIQQTISGNELQPATGFKIRTKNPQKTINGAQLHPVSINIEMTPDEILKTNVDRLEVR